MSATMAQEEFALQPEGFAGCFKRCACGREYTFAGWQRLPLVGFSYLEDDEGHALYESRNCACGSTLQLNWELP